MGEKIKCVLSRAKFREALGLDYSAQVNAFSERWGFALETGGDVDVLAALQAVLAKYKADIEGAEALKDQKLREEIEKLKHHNAQKRIELETLAGERIEVDRISDLLSRHAAELRGAGDLVARKSSMSGRDCQAVINNVVGILERDIERVFGG